MEQVNNLQQVIFLGLAVGVIYIVFSMSAKKMRQFSRGDFMRKLNKKMEKEQKDGKK